MGNYSDIRKEINLDQNITGGVLHPDGIYILGMNYYDEEIHGDKYNNWDYPRNFSLSVYPTEIKVMSGRKNFLLMVFF